MSILSLHTHPAARFDAQRIAKALRAAGVVLAVAAAALVLYALSGVAPVGDLPSLIDDAAWSTFTA